MCVDSTTETQRSTELVSLQDTLDSEQIAFVDTLDDEITTVIAESSRLQRYDYVVGEVSNYFVSPSDHIHFDLVHGDDDDQLRCIIFNSRRASVTTDINDGMQVAVTGDLSFHPPKNRCSIDVEEVRLLDTDGSYRLYEVLLARLWIAIAALLVIVLAIGGYILL